MSNGSLLTSQLTGLCANEQNKGIIRSAAKSCLLTHLLKHAAKLTAPDFNGMNLKWWKLETVEKHGPACLKEADHTVTSNKGDVENV